jgi:hypothetical protein
VVETQNDLVKESGSLVVSGAAATIRADRASARELGSQIIDELEPREGELMVRRRARPTLVTN